MRRRSSDGRIAHVWSRTSPASVPANSWTRAPDGSMYFVGPRGFFKMDAAATNGVDRDQRACVPAVLPEPSTGRTNFINVMYDADIYGVWIFVTPTVQSVTATTSMASTICGPAGFWPQRLRRPTERRPPLVRLVGWTRYRHSLSDHRRLRRRAVCVQPHEPHRQRRGDQRLRGARPRQALGRGCDADRLHDQPRRIVAERSRDAEPVEQQRHAQCRQVGVRRDAGHAGCRPPP
jgi:hypothetical protein